MSNLEQAVILMNDRWMSSLTEMADYVPSRKQRRNINRIDDKLRGGKYHKLTRRTVAVLVAAAILLAALTVAVANETSRKYIIEKFSQYSIYSVVNPNKVEVTPIETNYIPEGFEEVQNNNDNNFCSLEYSFDNKYFSIDKWLSRIDVYYDTEEQKYKTVEYNQIEYIFFKAENNNIGIIWNKGGYTYWIEGNLSENELYKIAISTK